MSKLRYNENSRPPTTDTVEEVTNLVQWVRKNPEQAAETGVKIVGFGLLVLTLAAIFME